MILVATSHDWGTHKLEAILSYGNRSWTTAASGSDASEALPKLYREVPLSVRLCVDANSILWQQNQNEGSMGWKSSREKFWCFVVYNLMFKEEALACNLEHHLREYYIYIIVARFMLPTKYAKEKHSCFPTKFCHKNIHPSDHVYQEKYSRFQPSMSWRTTTIAHLNIHYKQIHKILLTYHGIKHYSMWSN